MMTGIGMPISQASAPFMVRSLLVVAGKERAGSGLVPRSGVRVGGAGVVRPAKRPGPEIRQRETMRVGQNHPAGRVDLRSGTG
jgi:hypothetical protein